jgi:hypothetical protein
MRPYFRLLPRLIAAEFRGLPRLLAAEFRLLLLLRLVATGFRLLPRLGAGEFQAHFVCGLLFRCPHCAGNSFFSFTVRARKVLRTFGIIWAGSCGNFGVWM